VLDDSCRGSVQVATVSALVVSAISIHSLLHLSTIFLFLTNSLLLLFLLLHVYGM